MLCRRPSRSVRPSLGLGSSLCAFGVGTWLRDVRGRKATVASGEGTRPSAESVDRVGLEGSAGGGLEFLGVIDLRCERVEAAVVAGCAGAGAGSGARMATIGEDRLGSTGDGATGVACRLRSLDSGFCSVGVLGPAGASGT